MSVSLRFDLCRFVLMVVFALVCVAMFGVCGLCWFVSLCLHSILCYVCSGVSVHV